MSERHQGLSNIGPSILALLGLIVLIGYAAIAIPMWGPAAVAIPALIMVPVIYVVLLLLTVGK